MNEPKYEIGDRIEELNMEIRGLATFSDGKQKYFMQIADDTFVVGVEEFDLHVDSLKKFPELIAHRFLQK